MKSVSPTNTASPIAIGDVRPAYGPARACTSTSQACRARSARRRANSRSNSPPSALTSAALNTGREDRLHVADVLADADLGRRCWRLHIGRGRQVVGVDNPRFQHPVHRHALPPRAARSTVSALRCVGLARCGCPSPSTGSITAPRRVAGIPGQVGDGVRRLVEEGPDRRAARRRHRFVPTLRLIMPDRRAALHWFALRAAPVSCCAARNENSEKQRSGCADATS